MNPERGVGFPIGADPQAGGVNFSVFSDRAERVELLLWRRLIDTALPSPDDIGAFRDAPSVSTPTHRAQPRSVVLLAAELN